MPVADRAGDQTWIPGEIRIGADIDDDRAGGRADQMFELSWGDLIRVRHIRILWVVAVGVTQGQGLHGAVAARPTVV